MAEVSELLLKRAAARGALTACAARRELAAVSAGRGLGVEPLISAQGVTPVILSKGGASVTEMQCRACGSRDPLCEGTAAVTPGTPQEGATAVTLNSLWRGIPTLTPCARGREDPAVTWSRRCGVDPSVTSSTPRGVDPSATPSRPRGLDLSMIPSTPRGLDPSVTPSSPRGVDPSVTPSTPRGVDPSVTPSSPSGLDPVLCCFILRNCIVRQQSAVWNTVYTKELHLLPSDQQSASAQTGRWSRGSCPSPCPAADQKMPNSYSMGGCGTLTHRMDQHLKNRLVHGFRRHDGQPRILCRAYSKNSNKKDSQQALFRSKMAYYDILGVSPGATHAQIKTAYYKQSFIYHPDKNAGSEEAAQKFTEISEAYTVLGSISLRRKYDKGILSNSDLQTAGKPSGKVDSPMLQKKTTTVSTRFPFGKPIFDFDEFYRAHYGEQLERERILRCRKEQQQKQKGNLDDKWQMSKLMEMSVAILLVSAVALFFNLKASK